MQTSKKVALSGLGLILALTAAACGSSKTTTAPAATTAAGAVTTAAGAVTTAAPAAVTTAKAGADSTAAPAAGGGAKKMAILFDLKGRGDKSFNDSAAIGLDKAKKEFGYTVTEQVRTGTDAAEQLKLAVDAKNDLIIGVGFAWAEEMEKSATANPNIKFGIVDDGSSKQANVSGLIFKANEGSYLVGVAAGLKSKAKHVGFIGGVDIPLIQDFAVGFEAGAKSVDPAMKVDIKYISPAGDFSGFGDPAKAKTIALSQYEGGADVVYHAAGGSGDGLFGAAKEFSAKGSKVWAIGVDSDQATTVNPDLAPFILTSMIKHVDVAVYETMKAAAGGSFKGGVRVFSAKDGGVDYSTTGGYVDDIKAKLEAAKADIASGKITVPSKG
jgi:basic membrane protein A and related proteins